MAKADRAPIVMYRAQCLDAEEIEDIGALDAAEAARIHGERTYKRGNWPRATVGRGPVDKVRVQVLDPTTNAIETFTVRIMLEPVFVVEKPVWTDWTEKNR